ncbi:hypothetical protein BGX23_008534 [Mortierella sp. AD031]|nr:hypothetical protein BGX23_008534 [Mortierella sp. AD031]
MALKNLRRLELRFGSTFNAAWVEAIIRHCLDTLVDLAMEFLYPGLLRKPATGLPPGIAFPAWRILPNLRRLGYPNLVELEFCYGADYGLEVFQTLITTLASTLEVLRFTDEKVWPMSSRRHIQDRIPMVLESCPRLKVLDSIGLYAPQIGVTLQELTREPWATKELETLKIDIRDVDSNSIGNERDEPESDGKVKLVYCTRQGWVTREEKEAWELEKYGLLEKLAGYLKGNPHLDTLDLHWHSTCYYIRGGEL